MTLLQCEACRRHVRAHEPECPFCRAKRHRAAKVALAAAAGVAAMTVGIGCAYGMPEEYGADASPDAGSDATDDASGQ